MDGYTSELARSLAADVLDRLVRCVRIDSQAVRDRVGSPSSPGQLVLGRLLGGELLELGWRTRRSTRTAT